MAIPDKPLTRMEQYLNQIAQNTSGGGGGGSGGESGVLEVLFSAEWGDKPLPTITCDHTAEEIVSAKEAGKHIVCYLQYTNGTELFSLVEHDIFREEDTEGEPPHVWVRFFEHHAEGSMAMSGDVIGFTRISWNSSSDLWDVNQYYYAMTPSD